jgi:ribosomal protein S18 acetylase RimI-like enzyme
MMRLPITDPREPNGPSSAAAASESERIEVRDAKNSDLADLLNIESRCFESDRVSARSFRYLLGRAHAFNLVACAGPSVAGYVTVLLRRGSRRARVYSLAVDPRWQGRRIGSRLLELAEARAAAAGCCYIRLEVRTDNHGAIRQYRKAGYLQIGIKPGYYEDGESALQFEKRLDTMDVAGVD